MATTIPVPIEFSLPEGWRSVPPDDVGATEAAFVALRPPASEGFTPNITISGELRDDGASVQQVADEALTKLQGTVRNVQVGRRNQVGSAANPGFTQAVRMSVDLHGRAQEVVQFQVFVAMRDVREHNRNAVLHLVLSSTPNQFPDVIDDFHQFVATVKPEQGTKPQGGTP